MKVQKKRIHYMPSRAAKLKKKEEEEGGDIMTLIHRSWEWKLQKKKKPLSTKADHSQDFHPTEIQAYLLQRTYSGILMVA